MATLRPQPAANVRYRPAARARRPKRHLHLWAARVKAIEAPRAGCRCGVCPICLAGEKLDEARFARLIDPDYYRRPGLVHWESTLRGGLAHLALPAGAE